MSKTIGLVLNNTPGYSETFFSNKINSLMKEGYRVIVFAPHTGKTPAHWQVVSPYHLPKSGIGRMLRLAPVIGLTFLSAPSRVLKFMGLEKASGRSRKTAVENLFINAHILRHKLDWLHFGFATTAVRRENVATATGAQMAVSLRGYDIAVYPLKNPGCYDLLWKRVDKVHTISDDLLAIAHRFGLFAGKPTVKITPAIDYKKFDVGEHTKQATINILTVARLNWKKGLMYALHTIKALRDNGHNIRYTIIGDGAEKESLVFAVHQMGLSSSVVFTGVVGSDKIGQYYKDNTIYLQPSVQEGFCNAVLEAQAAGLLCIVSNAEGLPENVQHGVTGWVVPSRSVPAMTEAIEYIIALPSAERNKITHTASERVKNQFSIEKQTKEFLSFYAS